MLMRATFGWFGAERECNRASRAPTEVVSRGEAATRLIVKAETWAHQTCESVDTATIIETLSRLCLCKAGDTIA